MLRVKRNLLLVAMTVMLLVGLGTWVAFRFLVGEAPPTEPEYLPSVSAASVSIAAEPATPVRATDGALVFDFESETLGAEPKSVIPTVGQWIAGVDGKERVLVVDGRGWSRGQPSAGLADKARALYGKRYAEFLDNVQAYAYFPLAVAKGIDDFRAGEIELRFKCVAGRIDQAAGIVFNLKLNGDYLVLRANCLEDNLVLFKYERGSRSAVKWIRNMPTPSKQWHDLKLVVQGKNIKGYLDGKLYLEHALSEPVSGRIGLWSKADSVVYFDDIRVESTGRNE